MKNCSQCGAENPEAAKFCRKCGSPFAAEPVEAQPVVAPIADVPVAETPAADAPVDTYQPEAAATEPAAPEAAPVDAPASPIAEPEAATEVFQQVPEQQNTTSIFDQPAPMAQQSMPDMTASAQPFQAQQAPVQGMPAQGMPMNNAAMPMQGQSYQGQPFQAQPMQGQPYQSQPMNSTMPMQGMPAQGQQMPGQPYQGQPMPGQPYQGQAPAQSSAFKDFFVWLWQSFLRPAQVVAAQVWWSILSFALASFVMGLTSYIWSARAVSAVNNLSKGIFGAFGSEYSSYAPTIDAPISTLFKGWIIAFIFMYLIVLITFIGYRMMGDNTSFAALQTKVAQRLIPADAVILVSMLFGLIGGGALGISMFLYVVMMVMMASVPGALIAQAQCIRKLDRTWLWIFACIIGGVIMLIFLMILAASGVMSAASGISSMF